MSQDQQNGKVEKLGYLPFALATFSMLFFETSTMTTPASRFCIGVSSRIFLLLLLSHQANVHGLSPKQFLKRAFSRRHRPESVVSANVPPEATRFFRDDQKDQEYPFTIASDATTVIQANPLEKNEATIPGDSILSGFQYQQHVSGIIRPFDLPRHSRFDFEDGAAKAEMVLGRVAMIAALILLAVELATGQSLPEQLVALITAAGTLPPP